MIFDKDTGNPVVGRGKSIVIIKPQQQGTWFKLGIKVGFILPKNQMPLPPHPVAYPEDFNIDARLVRSVGIKARFKVRATGGTLSR